MIGIALAYVAISLVALVAIMVVVAYGAATFLIGEGLPPLFAVSYGVLVFGAGLMVIETMAFGQKTWREKVKFSLTVIAGLVIAMIFFLGMAFRPVKLPEWLFEWIVGNLPKR